MRKPLGSRKPESKSEALSKVSRDAIRAMGEVGNRFTQMGNPGRGGGFGPGGGRG